MVLPILAFLATDPGRLGIGTNWSGQEALHFTSRVGEIDETHRFKISWRVVGKEDKAWVVEKRSFLVSSRIAETELPPPPNADPTVAKEWVSTDGLLLDEEPFEYAAFYLDRAVMFWLPEKVPNQWSMDLSRSITHPLNSSRAQFNVTRSYGTSKEYSFTYAPADELPGISAEGAMRFDIATGRLISAKIEARDARLPGGFEKANVSITYSDTTPAKS